MARPSKSLVPRLDSRPSSPGASGTFGTRPDWSSEPWPAVVVAHPPPAGRFPTEIDARRRQTRASSNTRERELRVSAGSRAAARQARMAARQVQPAERGRRLRARKHHRGVVANLVSLAAHRAYVVERDLAGTRSGSRGDDSPPGHDVELRFRVHLGPSMNRQRSDVVGLRKRDTAPLPGFIPYLQDARSRQILRRPPGG